MTMRELLLEEFDQEMEVTRKILAALPEALPEFKPHEKSMPLPQLAGHIASLPAQAVRVITLEEFEVDIKTMKRFIPSTRTELLERFEQNIRDGHDAIAGASDENLWKTWTFKINGQAVFALPRLKVIRKQVLSHITHHRAQLGVYLRLLEIKVPGTYGPSADEMPVFAQASK
jgi:uncharacterized damage-inducible protein DinB